MKTNNIKTVMLNSFQHLHLNQTLNKEEEILNQVQDDNIKRTTHGFTLIELLVVVLIIAILTAVAVPQYKMAVLKARTMEWISVLHQIKQAEEVYYVQNGEYTTDFSRLDISSPCPRSPSDGNVYQCSNDFQILIRDQNGANNMAVRYCPGYGTSTWGPCWQNEEFDYRINLGQNTNERCTGYTPLGTAVCKVLL